MTFVRSSEQLGPIVWLRETTWISPCQWEGVLEDGRALYIQYKWGELSVRVAAAGSKEFYDSEPWFDDLVGNWKEPLIKLDEVLSLTGLRLALKVAQEMHA